MKGRIISRYELIMYDTGAIDIKPLNVDKAVDDYSSCSSRIKQVLSVVNEMENIDKNNSGLNDVEIYTSAISHVSKTLGVQQSTISDKLTRQLGKNADTIRPMILDYIRNGSPDLKTLLLSKVSKNSKSEDIQAITNTLI